MKQLIAVLMLVTFAVPATRASQTTDAAARAREHLALVEQAAGQRQGPQASTWIERIKSNEAELERSLDWLVQNGQADDALRFAHAMAPFWMAFGELPHARTRLSQALALPGAAAPTLIRARVLYDAGVLAFRQDDRTASRTLNEDSLAIGQQLGDKAVIASAHIGLSRIALREHDYESVRAHAQAALRLRQEMNDAAGEEAAVHMLAAAARMSDDNRSAAKYYELTLGIAGEAGNKGSVAGELMNLGFVHVQDHDPDWAFRLFKESVSIYKQILAEDGLMYNLNGLAAVAAERRDGRTAARLFGALDAALHKLGITLDPDDQIDYDRYTALARQQLGAETFQSMRAEGERLSIDAALALALTTH